MDINIAPHAINHILEDYTAHNNRYQQQNMLTLWVRPSSSHGFPQAFRSAKPDSLRNVNTTTTTQRLLFQHSLQNKHKNQHDYLWNHLLTITLCDFKPWQYTQPMGHYKLSTGYVHILSTNPHFFPFSFPLSFPDCLGFRCTESSSMRLSKRRSR